MNIIDEFRMEAYQDLGSLEDDEKIRLKRHRDSGRICLEKRVPYGQISIYQFLQEQKIPGIPEIFACIADEEELIVIEKYIEGRTLESLLGEKVLTEDEVIDLTLSLCEILAVLHQGESPIICRDLKAENVIIDEEDRVWLVDFDIARVYQEGKKRDTELLGTAEYAAPEQFGFFQTDNRTDIYSLGVLINYMVKHKFPVEEMAVGELGKIIEKCTYLDPAKRYQRIEDVQQALETLRRKNEKQSEHQSVSKRHSWIPPGFRSGNPWHMVTATMGYFFVTWTCFNMVMTKEDVPLTGYMLRMEQGILWLSQILFILLLYNYRGCQAMLPLVRSKKIFFRAIGLIAAEGILIFAAIFLCAVLDTFFF